MLQVATLLQMAKGTIFPTIFRLHKSMRFDVIPEVRTKEKDCTLDPQSGGL
jgi:hypothetical protein